MKTKLKNKQEEGITLIALVVTIVVLLILAGISLNLVLGQNGVIGKAKDAKNLTEKGQAQDEVNLAINYLQIEDATSTLTQEDKRKILEDELRKISADSSVSISGSGYKITHKKYDFFVDEDLKISSSGKTFDAVEWDKKAAPEDIFIWKSDDPNNADYGVVIGYKKNVDNYTILRFPSRCTEIDNIYNSDMYKDTGDDEPTVRSYTKNILKVEMPNTVKKLGIEAFSGDYGGFYFSSLERVELSKSLSKIEDYAFGGCKNLNDIEIPDNIVEIGAYAFLGCENLYYIEIPDNITKIGSGAFSGCRTLESITIPEGVREISDSSFAYCSNLQQINLPEGLEKIGSGAFSGCKIFNIGLPDNMTQIGSAAFSECGTLESITIPAGVKEISAGCFRNCENLQQINLPDGLEKIGNNVFTGCKAIKSVTIPEGVKEIGDSSFYFCSNLQQINLPERLEKIGDEAFYSCDALKSITIPKSVKKIGEDCFAFSSNLQQINLPEGLESIGVYAFSCTRSLSEIIIPASVKIIGYWAFNGWTSSQTIKCKATKAGENWDQYWNYNYPYGNNKTKISANIIWGYQDNNT